MKYQEIPLDEIINENTRIPDAERNLPNETTSLKKSDANPSPYVAKLLYLTGSLCFASMNLCVRAIRIIDPIPLLEIQFGRGLVGIVMTMMLMKYHKVEFLGPKSCRKLVL